MWGAKNKIKPVDVWHTKAMLIDPRKTKLTIIWNAKSEICENEEKSETPKLTVETEEVETNEPREATSSEENIENTKANLGDVESNFETSELDDFEIQGITEVSENLEDAKPTLQNMESSDAEVQISPQAEEDIETIEQNLGIIELNPPEAVNTIASSENLIITELDGTGAVATCKTDEANFELIPNEKEQENAMFLSVLKKTRSKWYNDKQFAKIVKKMEKGKKLKRKEFDKVFMHIRNYCQFN